MSQTARLYLIDQLLNERRVVSFKYMQEALGVSRATLRRDLDYMRDRLNAPLEWSREAGGYRFAPGRSEAGPSYALPGLWFNEREIHALLTAQHLLSDLGMGGILSNHIAPLMARLNVMLGSANDAAQDIRKKVLIAGVGRRRLPLAHFQQIGKALLDGQRLRITYTARSTDETTEREVSPLRLVHYRENWYLDGWCHLRGEVRNFSLDRIEAAVSLPQKARRVALAHLAQTMGPAYGIFARGTLKRAQLRFTPRRARWVAQEQWHPDQDGQYDGDGHYLLSVPYSDDRELLMDILRYGADCEVMRPPELRERIMREINDMQHSYQI